MSVCKICLENIPLDFEDSLLFLFHPHLKICPKCFFQFHPIFRTFIFYGVSALAIYSYDEWIEQLLYRFKEQKDIELKSVFLEFYHLQLHLRYRGYHLVPMPSSKEKEEKREFSTLKEVFQILDLPFLDLFEKKQDFKQEKAHREERFKNRQEIILKKDIPSLHQKKLLLIDDVMTTGATILRAIELIKPLMPKKIKILVLSKNDGKRR